VRKILQIREVAKETGLEKRLTTAKETEGIHLRRKMFNVKKGEGAENTGMSGSNVAGKNCAGERK